MKGSNIDVQVNDLIVAVGNDDIKAALFATLRASKELGLTTTLQPDEGEDNNMVVSNGEFGFLITSFGLISLGG